MFDKDVADRITRGISTRESQLKEMSRQLQNHKAMLLLQEDELHQLSEEVSFLSSKVSLKDEQLEHELKDKEALFSRVLALEKLVERNTEPSKPVVRDDSGLISAYMEYFNTVKVQGASGPFMSVPSFEVEMPEFTPETEEGVHDAPKEDEADIAKELEKMGLSDLMSKY